MVNEWIQIPADFIRTQTNALQLRRIARLPEIFRPVRYCAVEVKLILIRNSTSGLGKNRFGKSESQYLIRQTGRQGPPGVAILWIVALFRIHFSI